MVSLGGFGDGPARLARIGPVQCVINLAGRCGEGRVASSGVRFDQNSRSRHKLVFDPVEAGLDELFHPDHLFLITVSDKIIWIDGSAKDGPLLEVALLRFLK